MTFLSLVFTSDATQAQALEPLFRRETGLTQAQAQGSKYFDPYACVARENGT